MASLTGDYDENVPTDASVAARDRWARAKAAVLPSKKVKGREVTAAFFRPTAATKTPVVGGGGGDTSTAVEASIVSGNEMGRGWFPDPRTTKIGKKPFEALQAGRAPTDVDDQDHHGDDD